MKSGQKEIWRKRSGTNHRVAGFTFVELIAIIAILCILAALLLPGLQRAVETATRVTCANNQAQLGIGVANYAADNRGFLPITTFDNQGISYTSGFIGKGYDPSLGNRTLTPCVVGFGALFKTFTEVGDFYHGVFVDHYSYAPKEMFTCPSNGKIIAYMIPRGKVGGPSFAGWERSSWRFPRGNEKYFFTNQKTSVWKAMGACHVKNFDYPSTPHKNEGTNVLNVDGSVNWSPNPHAPLWWGIWYKTFLLTGNDSMSDFFWYRVNSGKNK